MWIDAVIVRTLLRDAATEVVEVKKVFRETIYLIQARLTFNVPLTFTAFNWRNHIADVNLEFNESEANEKIQWKWAFIGLNPPTVCCLKWLCVCVCVCQGRWGTHSSWGLDVHYKLQVAQWHCFPLLSDTSQNVNIVPGSGLDCGCCCGRLTVHLSSRHWTLPWHCRSVVDRCSKRWGFDEGISWSFKVQHSVRLTHWASSSCITVQPPVFSSEFQWNLSRVPEQVHVLGKQQVKC